MKALPEPVLRNFSKLIAEYLLLNAIQVFKLIGNLSFVDFT